MTRNKDCARSDGVSEPDLSAMDPQARRLLAMIALGGPHEAGQVTPAERRRSFEKLMRFSKPPEAVVAVDDLAVPARGRAIPIRRYTPGAADQPGPGLVYFHGGGLVAGGLATHDALCRTLAHAASCRVFSVHYRLAPENPFPAAVVDALLAARWLLRHVAEVGLRPGRIAVGGDSGGATLATIVCQVMRRPGAIRAQVLLCPVLDFGAASGSRRRFASGFLLDAATMAADLRHYAPRRPLEDPRISPLRAKSLAGMPETFIHTAGFDPLLDEGAAYARRLSEAGVPVRYRCHESLVHHFYALNGVIPAAQRALMAIADDIAAVLS